MFMVTEREASLDWRAADRIIVPFVSDERDPTTRLVRLSRPDEIHSWVEVGVELVLVVAGVAGVLAGVVGR
jgi:hypothetical protein